MSQVDRLYYAVQKIYSASVVSFGYADWFRLVRPDGAITELEELPPKLNNPNLAAVTVVAVASGIANVQPGMDVLRHDPQDAPYILNLDHYTVLENLHLHEIYPEALSVAGIEDSPTLRFELQNNVYVIKEPPNDHHWMKDFPAYILEAKKRFK
jgi:hypothetical protein